MPAERLQLLDQDLTCRSSQQNYLAVEALCHGKGCLPSPCAGSPCVGAEFSCATNIQSSALQLALSASRLQTTYRRRVQKAILEC